MTMTRRQVTRETRIRRMAGDRGLVLEKCPHCHPERPGFGLYRLRHGADGHLVAGGGPGGFGLTLDQAGECLREHP